MAGESQDSPTSGVPDPSVLTTEALTRAIDGEAARVNAELAIRDEKLKGIDKATVVYNEALTRVPTDTQKEVGHLRELTYEKFNSVETQFELIERQRVEQKKDTKDAVDAALAAAKEAVQEQTKASGEAIGKSEALTKTQLEQQNTTFNTGIASVVDKLDDLKDRIVRLETRNVVTVDNKSDHRADSAQVVGYIMMGVAIIAIIISVVLALVP